MKNQKGFTLIELLLVLAIIGIISAIAVPALLGQRENAKNKATAALADGLVAAVQTATDICENVDYLPAQRPVLDLQALPAGPNLTQVATVVLARADNVAAKNAFTGAPAFTAAGTAAANIGEVGFVSARDAGTGQVMGTVTYGMSVNGAAVVKTTPKKVETTLAP